MTTQLDPTTTEATDPVRAIGVRLRTLAVAKIEEMLAELPATMRRLRTLLAVLSVTIPLFLLAVAAALWHLAW